MCDLLFGSSIIRCIATWAVFVFGRYIWQVTLKSIYCYHRPYGNATWLKIWKSLLKVIQQFIYSRASDIRLLKLKQQINCSGLDSPKPHERQPRGWDLPLPPLLNAEGALFRTKHTLLLVCICVFDHLFFP